MSDLIDRSQEIGSKFLAWTPETGPCPISINDHYWFKKLCALFETQAELEARIAELSQAVGLITTLKPTMVMDANHPLDMVREVAEHVTARIAELETEPTELRTRLAVCEDALISMVQQFFYSAEGSNVYSHAFMSAEEEAAAYLVKFGIAEWNDTAKSKIMFLDSKENNQ